MIGLHHSADKNVDDVWYVLFALRYGKSKFVEDKKWCQKMLLNMDTIRSLSKKSHE
jgi:hypothetical protein